MKKISAVLLIITLVVCCVFCTSISTSAAIISETTIELLDNGDYIETIITYDETTARASTKSGSKTSNYKNSSGETMWSVTVNGTFSYNGTTAFCTKVSHSAAAYASGWSIKNSSSSKVGYTATANATATHKVLLVSTDYSMTVSLSCSPQGVLS